MTALAYYLLKVVICSGILFCYYHLALKNKNFHQWNRFYLLAAVVLSLLLPLIQFTVWHSPEQETKAIDIILLVQSADSYLEEITVASSPSVSPEQWILFGYLFACLLLMISFIMSLLKIRQIIKAHPVQEFDDVRFINTNEPGSPFSFLQYIFWNEKISLQTEVGQQIFQHELVHVKEKHTLDKLFMQTVLVVFWCNPFFWLIRRELKFIHEFIADNKAMAQHGSEAFAAMIMQAAFPQHYHSITNQFFQTSIKRRLLMLTKIHNPKLAYISRIVALPLVAFTIFAFTIRAKPIAETEGSKPVENSASNATILQKVGVANDTIPKSKKEITAIDVRKSGDKKINEITITYSDGSSETLSEQEAMAKGLINGNYSNQRLDSHASAKSYLRIKGTGPAPLYILDGKESASDEIGKLDPKAIQSINVLKGASAINAYGEKGKDGVVEIRTKKQLSDERITLQQNGKNVNTDSVSKAGVSGEVTVIGFKTTRTTSTANEPIFEKAEFPPSVDHDEWRSFLEKYAKPFIEEASKTAPSGRYTVNVNFIIEKDGSLSNIRLLNDPGYGMGPKVLEMMKHAPKWKPAIQNQRAVRAIHTRPITFVISNGKADPTTS